MAQKNQNPIIEGNKATILWKGKTAPHFIDDIHIWEDHPQKMTRIEKELWAYSMELPVTAYLEYSFYEPRTKQRIEDPLNGNAVYNGIGHYNHFFYMPEHSPTPLAEFRKNIPHGKVTHHLVETWMLADNGQRDVYFYRPPVKEPVPLLIVYDGADYLERTKLNVIVDNLIHEKRIRPIALAFLQNGGDHRGVEYACSDATIMWLDNIILPLARKKLNLLDIAKHAGAYGALGASFGGLMSMYTGLRMPEIFGKVISQSGVFESEGRNFAAVDLVHAKQSREIKIWMDVGHFDWLLEDNRRLQPILRENGYDVTYREFSGGHNYTCWRDEVWIALEKMFG
ncbi:MAG: alpha/beta hydrolase-fold protein [Anaerolineales bacterium]|nr:alpha/beta hydrolase-fold protein [Anaerolineales bacterium]